MIFRKEYALESYYSKDISFIDNASILETFSAVSKAHTDFVRLTLPEDIVWMVLDWKLRIKRRPKVGELCNIRTWVPEWTKACGLRCYDIIDSIGCKCAEASSRWALVNAKTRKLFRMTADIMDLYGIDKDVSDIEKEPFIKNIAKNIIPIKRCFAEISEDMIDANGHIHNTIYSTLAETVLSDGANVDSVDISYRKEISHDDKLILDYCLHENNNMVLIKTAESSAPNAIVLFDK